MDDAPIPLHIKQKRFIATLRLENKFTTMTMSRRANRTIADIAAQARVITGVKFPLHEVMDAVAEVVDEDPQRVLGTLISRGRRGE